MNDADGLAKMFTDAWTSVQATACCLPNSLATPITIAATGVDRPRDSHAHHHMQADGGSTTMSSQPTGHTRYRRRGRACAPAAASPCSLAARAQTLRPT